MRLHLAIPTYVLCVAASILVSACGETTDPPAPTLDALPSVTADDPLAVSGMSEPSATIQVRGGADVAEGVADADGRFEVLVGLRPDAENTLLVSQVVDGAESPTAMATVTHDGMPPEVPMLDAPVSPTRLTTQTVRGSAEAGAMIEIMGGASDTTGAVGTDGRFSIDVDLTSSASDPVDNDLSVVAVDEAGNRSAAASVTITFDPNIAVEAPRFDDPPGFTNAGTITLTGTSEPGVGITVAGGATTGSATAAGDGSFSVDVGLRPNTENTLLGFAVSGTDTSAAVTLRVTHDDTAPDAPEVNPQASPTGAVLARLTGLSEPAAEIAVTGGSAAASGTADDTGAFSVDVMLTVDATNDLAVVATDRAGNPSDPTNLTIVQDSSLETPVSVDPVTSPTAMATVRLSGTAAASVMVQIDGGASTVTTSSDTAGAWMADVALRLNARNELRLTRPGSGVETLVTIEHDDIAPAAPSLNALASPTPSTMIDVTGTTESRARVSVTGATAAAADNAMVDGRFSVAIVIAEDTETMISVIATDRAGNSSVPATASVTHSSTIPAAPTLDETNPPPTNMATYEVTGSVAMPGAGIEAVVRGGASDATAMTDPSTGAFSVTVTLTPNASNELRVVSREGAVESAEALATVLHDDIAPTAPVGASLTAMSAGCVVGVPTGGNVSGAAGSVEGRGRVEITNVTRSATATTNATDMGSFSVALQSCAGDVIRVIVVDAATNASPPTEINAS